MSPEECEILKLAAKAAGLSLYKEDLFETGLAIDTGNSNIILWNPLHNRAQVFELAAVLGLVVDFSKCAAGLPWSTHVVWIDDLCDNATAACRAIVFAAAEIGKKMQ